MSIHSMTLLPQSGETLLMKSSVAIKILDNYKFLIKKTISALENFIKEKYYLFDPHVGDTACQVRAYKILSIVNEHNKENILKDIYLLNKKYEELSVFSIKFSDSRTFKKAKIYDFLNENNLIFYISEESLFLSISYILSEIKTKGQSNEIMIDHDYLSSMMSISKKSSRKLVHYYQKIIAELSARFVFDILLDLPENNKTRITLDKLTRIDGDGRKILPCYLTMKILLSHMVKTKKTILINLKIKNLHGFTVDTLSLFYKFSGNVFENPLIKNSNKFQDTPLIIIDAMIENEDYFSDSKNSFIRHLKEEGFANLMLYCMAAHPQYPSSNASHENIFNKITNYDFMEVSDEIHKMKSNAEKKGCSVDNKKLFFIEHIYCDKPRNRMKFNYNEIMKSHHKNEALV